MNFKNQNVVPLLWHKYPHYDQLLRNCKGEAAQKAQCGTKAVLERRPYPFILTTSMPINAVKTCNGRNSQK
jgi:hypothetical protein